MSKLNDFAIYCRVSTTNQNIETQLREAQGYCQRNGIVEYKTYADIGISGSTASRPQLDAMLTDLRAGRIKTIIVYKLDRVGRSLMHLLDLLAELRNRNVRLVSISDGLDTSNDNPMNRAFFRLLGVFGEMEREIIRERVMSGLAHAKASGKKLGRPAGSKDKGKRSRSGYFLRYCGRSKSERKIGPRVVSVTPQGEQR